MNTPRVKSPNAHLLDNPEWLRSEYFDKNKSLLNICESIPCAKLTVLRRFKKYGIETKPKYVTYSDVVYPDRKGESSPTWKGGNNKCIDCNKLLGSRNATRCVQCRGKSNRGENNACWKPKELHNTVLNNRIRHSADAKDWRNAVFVRDGYMCKICGENTRTLAAHHLDAFEIFPKKRFDVDNGVTLCGVHHTQFHRLFGFGKNTAEQFQEYVEQMTTEVTF